MLRLCNVAARARNATKSMQKAHNLALRLFNFGIGRETHKMMLDHYQQTKNLLVSYSENKLGFF